MQGSHIVRSVAGRFAKPLLAIFAAFVLVVLVHADVTWVWTFDGGSITAVFHPNTGDYTVVDFDGNPPVTMSPSALTQLVNDTKDTHTYKSLYRDGVKIGED